MPDNCHPASLPQLLSGFRIHSPRPESAGDDLSTARAWLAAATANEYRHGTPARSRANAGDTDSSLTGSQL
jgi:hypothetical protein